MTEHYYLRYKLEIERQVKLTKAEYDELHTPDSTDYHQNLVEFSTKHPMRAEILGTYAIPAWFHLVRVLDPKDNKQ